jgi:glutathione peroxidase
MIGISRVLSLILTLLFPGYLTIAQKPANMHSKRSIYDYTFKGINDSAMSFSAYKGKKILIVNVASKCGFTPQYEDLEKLYRKYSGKLVIVGFPANNFGSQEPGTNTEIATFCKLTYDVTFPMAAKVSVIGDDQCDVYKWLTDKSLNGWNEQAPKWNFTKYLIGEDGELLKVFPSKVKPLSAEITGAL